MNTSSDSHEKPISVTKFKTVEALGLNVFYREAGENAGPKLLLLGGFPSSSHQFPRPHPRLSRSFPRGVG